jgi:predicted nucleic acid-binding protein
MIRLQTQSRVYVDSNVWVYHVEGVRAWSAAIASLFDAVDASEAQLVSSTLAFAECVYRPAKEGNQTFLEAFEELFDQDDLDIVPVDDQLLLRAARRGGQLGLKLLDAAHYIAALEDGCRHFVTADTGFRSGPALDVIVLNPRN